MSSNPPINSPKQRAAEAAAALVQNGMAVGLGTGTTAELVIRALSERVAEEGLKFLGVPTSVETAELASTLRIPLRELDDVDVLDLNLDGADEIDPEFRMIKGRGGALLREKLVVTAARKRVTVITEEKQVAKLGLNALIPVEVSPIGSRHTQKRLQALGAQTTLRIRADGDAGFASPAASPETSALALATRFWTSPNDKSFMKRGLTRPSNGWNA